MAQVIHELLNPFALIAIGIPHHANSAHGFFTVKRPVDAPFVRVEASRHFGNDRHAVSQRDQLLYGRELADAVYGDGLHGLLPTVRGNVIGEAVGLVEHDERIFFDSLGGDLIATHERVASGHDEKELFIKKSSDLEVLGDDGQREDRKVDFTVIAALQEVLGRVFLYDDRDIRVESGKGAE